MGSEKICWSKRVLVATICYDLFPEKSEYFRILIEIYQPLLE